MKRNYTKPVVMASEVKLQSVTAGAPSSFPTPALS